MKTIQLFSELVVARKNELWVSSGGSHTPVSCESQRITQGASLDVWKCCEHWQRKLSNKLNAKTFAQGLGASVAKLLWNGINIDEIPFTSLPSKYVIKLVNGWASEQVVPVYEGIDLLRAHSATPSDIKHFFRDMREREQFRDVEILVEEFIQTDAAETLPLDYKVYCFGGRPEYVQVINRSFRTDAWYTPDWKRVPDRMQLCFAPEPVIQNTPVQLGNLLNTATKLSHAYDYPFVRIDFYLTASEVIFGEFTHTPFSGKSLSLFTSYANETLGRMWSCALKNWMKNRQAM